MIELIEKVIVATYTVLLPFLIKALHEGKKARKEREAEHIKANEEITETLKEIKGEIKEIKRTVDDERFEKSRYRILRFDDEMAQGEIHSEDHWQQIRADIDVYELYVSNHPDFKNGIGKAAMQRIKDVDNKRHMKGVEDV